MEKEQKISIVVPVYNTEKYLKKCLDSILNQTYRSIELIVVNDCSKGNAREIVDRYKENYPEIKYVEHEKNMGLFQARLTGSLHATGDYIAFVDSDDYVSTDLYRRLISKAVSTNADIVTCKTVIEEAEDKRHTNQLADLNFEEINGDECLNHYFHQRGQNYQWHTIWNKIYKKTIWDKAYPSYLKINQHLIMTEDFAFSTVLYYYASKIVTVDDAYYFYCQHIDASTTTTGVSYNKANKNISDIILSFEFVTNFLKSKKIYSKYANDLQDWANTYIGMWARVVRDRDYSEEEKNILFSMLNKLGNVKKEINIVKDAFYSQSARWSEQYETIVKAIASPSIKAISFDVFDTLVWRPFLEPKDIFYLMNDYFREAYGHKTLLKFSDIRPLCEEEARHIYNNKQDVTYEQIYNHMMEKYCIPVKVIELLKLREIDLELKYCMPRKSVYELYAMAKYLGKKIIFTSDMYLPKKVIEEIVAKNGYTDVNHIYLSNDIGLAKCTGDLFDYVIKDQRIKQSELIHIGDNYRSDVEMPNKKGIQAFLFPKASDTFFNGNPFVSTNHLGVVFKRNLPEWRDSRSSIEFMGIRSMLAVVANKYFDNPFTPFNENSDFNGDPLLIGYYALGMHMFALVNWLLKDSIDNKYEKMIFMARDGYLPREIWNVLKSSYAGTPKDYYFPTSRRSLMSLSMSDVIDLHKLHNFVVRNNNTPLQVISYLPEILNLENVDLKKLFNENGIDVNKKFPDKNTFEKFIFILATKLYDKKKANRYIADFKKSYDNLFEGKVAVFDIGYSAKPEAILSNIFGKSVDTYFVHINSDEGIGNANSFDFKIRTFFDYKPSYTGGIRETLISELGPSCIAYKRDGHNIVPEFEDYSCDYYEEKIIGDIQKSAVEFCKDMQHIFTDDISKLTYERYGASLPHEMFLHSASIVDKSIFLPMSFEDTVGTGGSISVTDMLNDELIYHNQFTIRDLLSFNQETLNQHPRTVELENRSKPIRLLYYSLFERETLKRRIREIVKNERVIKALKWNYGLLRKGKNGLRRLTLKNK